MEKRSAYMNVRKWVQSMYRYHIKGIKQRHQTKMPPGGLVGEVLWAPVAGRRPGTRWTGVPQLAWEHLSVHPRGAGGGLGISAWVGLDMRQNTD